MAFQLGILLVATALFTVTAWLARGSLRDPALRTPYLLCWAVVLLGFVSYTGLSFLTVRNIVNNDPELAKELALGDNALSHGLLAIGISVVASLGLGAFVVSRRLRIAAARLFPEFQVPQWNDATRPWTLQIRGFNPDIPIHGLALAMAVLFFCQTLADFVIAGGQAGLATGDISQWRIVVSTGFTAVMLITVSLVGTGFLQDRSLPQVLWRLGLRWPTLNEIVMGIGVAITLLAFQFCAGAVWMFLTPEGVFEQQTQLSQAIAGSVTGLPAAFLVALFSSWGEEIAFRGALQPVIGLMPTALLFALTHIQYELTPAALIILVVGLLFGWSRKHYGTITSIVAHFTYNFTLLTLAVVASRIVDTQGVEAILRILP